VGKGGRIRTVPMPSWTKTAIAAWASAVGITEGLVFRSINKGGRVTGSSMTAQTAPNPTPSVLWSSLEVIPVAAPARGKETPTPPVSLEERIRQRAYQLYISRGNPGVLKRIAAASGGECFLPGDIDQVIQICKKIAKDIRSRYTIGYTPARTDNKPGLRRIRVEAVTADHEKLAVRTRSGYSLK